MLGGGNITAFICFLNSAESLTFEATGIAPAGLLFVVLKQQKPSNSGTAGTWSKSRSMRVDMCFLCFLCDTCTLRDNRCIFSSHSCSHV